MTNNWRLRRKDQFGVRADTDLEVNDGESKIKAVLLERSGSGEEIPKALMLNRLHAIHCEAVNVSECLT